MLLLLLFENKDNEYLITEYNRSIVHFRNIIFDISDQVSTRSKDWKAKFKLDYGLCFSYFVPEYLHASEIREITFFTKNSVDIYLQHPGQYLSWEVYGFPVRTRQEIHVDTYYEVMRFSF